MNDRNHSPVNGFHSKKDDAFSVLKLSSEVDEIEMDGNTDDFVAPEDFSDSVEDLSQLLKSNDPKSMQVCLLMLQEELNQIKKTSSQISVTLRKTEQALQQELNEQQKNRDKELESERRIQNLLSEYIEKITEARDKQEQMDKHIMEQNQTLGIRVERLNQSFKLCMSRIRDSGKYQVYWGCAVFFLWCLWPFLLIKSKVPLVGFSKIRGIIIKKLHFHNLRKVFLLVLFSKLPVAFRNRLMNTLRYSSSASSTIQE